MPARNVIGAFALFPVFGVLDVVGAQEPPPTFPSAAQVVVLDVVATDAKGRPVGDLRADEIQVFEDGRACEIQAFRLVRAAPRPADPSTTTTASGATPGRAPARAAAAQPTPVRASLVVLVFDRLTTSTAPLARQGALDLLARDFPPDTWFAVFKVDYGARLLASFTTDRARIQSAIEGATLGSADKVAAGSAPAVEPPPLLPQVAGPQGIVLPDLRTVAEAVGGEEARTQLATQSLDSLYAVLGIARALGSVEGRKAVVYFAEGWQLDPFTTRNVYDKAVSEANRANVAVHTVDTRGLTSHKTMALTATDSVLDAFTVDARGAGTGSRTPGEEANGGLAQGGFAARGLEQREQQLHGPALERIADDTGGLAIENTNALGAGLARVAEELHQYYEVVYAPANPVQDGRFRHISVKLSRAGVRLRTRAGYFATPTRAPALLTYELPLLNALAADPPARDFSLRSRVLHFAPKGRERECVLLAEVPLSEVQLAADEASGVYRAHLALLGHLKDEGGRVVARLTHDWPIEGPLPEREQARQRSAVFRRTLTLAPGRYQLEAAVQDRRSGGTSVTRTTVEVPPVGTELSLGSVVTVERVGRAGPGDSPTDPLRVGEVALVPDLGAALDPAARAELPIYVPVYPARRAEGVELTVELRREGKIVARSAPSLPATDTDGRIPWIGSIPSAGLSAGSYEIAVTARQGEAVAEGQARFEIAARRARPPTAPAAEPRPIDTALVPVLERAGRYVVDYEDKFRNLVAEELYAQVADVPGGQTNRIDYSTGRRLVSNVYQERKTRADLVFVRLAGDVPWGLFRDVFEVNGAKVRDRDSRLERLFLHPSPSALDQARKILEESARYNIGGASRTLNLPTLPLVFLHPRNQPRFSFEAGGHRRIAGYETLEVRFEERRRPTIVTDAAGGDLPAQGRFWIDTSRGAVVRSEVVFRFEPRLAEGEIETEYRPQPRLGLWVPYEMKEDYRDLPGAARPVFHAPTHATARYSNFRQFRVSTEEKAALPQEQLAP